MNYEKYFFKLQIDDCWSEFVSAFFKDFSVVGQNCQRPIFLAPPELTWVSGFILFTLFQISRTRNEACLCPKKYGLILRLPQNSMRSPKVWAEYRRHELARRIWGHAPLEIFKIWVSEIAFPALWEHILKKSQLLKTQAAQSCKGRYNNVYYCKNMS